MSGAKRHKALRAKLIAAAERMISQSGLAGLKARDLAREIGCALGGIYTVFPDLDALVFEVNGRTLDAIDGAIRAARDAEAGRSPASADPVGQLATLAATYLDYATRNRRRWEALFAHAPADGQPKPEAYLERRTKLFRHLEVPLSALCLHLIGPEISLLARSLFSAVHGVVSLGLDETLTPMPVCVLRSQVRVVAEAVACGLTAASVHGTAAAGPLLDKMVEAV